MGSDLAQLELKFIMQPPAKSEKPDAKLPEQPDRRDFMKKACCVAIGGVLTAVPVAAGVVCYLDPLLRNAGGGSAAGIKVRVTTLDAVPDDGVPHRFPVLASQVDAWTKTPDTPIGAVYLLRTKDPQKPVIAFNVTCPHAGCFVDYVATLPDYSPAQPGFLCPCHNSTFKLDGSIAGQQSPSPRGLDALDCFIQNGNEVWMQFQNFQAGTSAKVPRDA
jgi:Rieske Fe-S protein